MLRSLIIAQVALAFVLANGAVLFSTSYLKVMQENELLATDAVVSAQIALNGPRYKEDAASRALLVRIVERVRALPGVTNAADHVEAAA